MKFFDRNHLTKYTLLGFLLILSGCDSTEGTLGGAAVGTGMGALIGYAAGGTGGAALGGAVGGLGGAALGHNVGKLNEQKNSTRPSIQDPYRYNDALEEYELQYLRKEVARQRLLNEKYEESELRALRKESERQRLLNEKLRLEQQRKKIINQR